MPFPPPDTLNPVIFPDGTVHPKTVFLSAAIEHPNWEVGPYTYASAHDQPADWAARLAPFLYAGAPERLSIGSFGQIADGVQFVTASANHRYQGISSYPFAIFDGMQRDRPSLQIEVKDTVIGHDVWLGTGATVLPGARIGSGVIVGAGAVVGGTVPDYAVVAGNPGRVVRMRFSPDEIALLLQISWWHWPIAHIIEHEAVIVSGDLEALQRAAPGKSGERKDMLAVISPAKNLNFEPVAQDVPLTEPLFSEEAVRLADRAAALSVGQIKSMMQLSDALATLNYERFQAFAERPARGSVKQAALAFAGDTYQGLQFEGLDPAIQARAQERLAILSGLYGVLRPFDAIQPYRLEMGRKLRTERGGSLYDFWGRRIADALQAQAAEQGAAAVVNCASVEYFSAVKTEALAVPVITPVFLEEKAGQRKVISFYAKRARGAMARWMMAANVTEPGALAGFAEDGYAFDAAESASERPVFVRKAG